ncbi:hypothetical protein DDN72_17380 [Vibrio cholerae]|nr:hypothetical protein [Vibrio cholerae]
MKTLLLKQGSKETSFIYEDYEITRNDAHGTLATITFYKGNGNTENYVQLQCTNKAVNISTLDNIIMKKIVKTGVQDTYATVMYDSVMIAGKTFYTGQSEKELDSFISSGNMPLSKAKHAEIVKAMKASKQVQIDKQAATINQPKRNLKDFVAKHKVKSDEAVQRDELMKSVLSKLKKNQPEKAEQKQETLADYVAKHKTSNDVNAQAIIEKMRRQSAPKADFSATGNMVIDGQEICLTKAHDLQLLSITQYIEKHLGSLDKLTINQQWDYVEFIKSLTTIKDAIQLEKLATNFVNKILGK